MSQAKSRTAADIPFDTKARTAFWYAIEEAFGGEMYDAMANAYWSEELEALEDRTRKRLRLLDLSRGGHVPKVLQAFIIKTATPVQLEAVAEEALAVGVLARLEPNRLRKLKGDLEQALEEGGVEAKFEASGKLVRGAGVDAAPKAIADLPSQAQFKTDLAAQAGTLRAVVFVDLDNFKSVNDEKGHRAGDHCLAKVVDVIGGCIAGKGRLYRYGGDEFAVILPNADVDEAAATAERVRRAIESARPGDDVDVSASIGVAASDQSSLDDAEKLLEAADRATYASKEAGKNRVTKWQAGTEASPVNSRAATDRIRRLVDLAEFAVHNLQNDSQDDSAADLSDRRHAWEGEVLEALADARATESDQSSFRVLGTYSQKNLPGRTPEHRKIVNEVAEKIERLRAITRRLEESRRPR